MKNVRHMTLLQLALHVASLPDRPVIWTQFDRDARDEYDRRVVALEQGAAA